MDTLPWDRDRNGRFHPQEAGVTGKRLSDPSASRGLADSLVFLWAALPTIGISTTTHPATASSALYLASCTFLKFNSQSHPAAWMSNRHVVFE